MVKSIQKFKMATLESECRKMRLPCCVHNYKECVEYLISFLEANTFFPHHRQKQVKTKTAGEL